jgi:cysteine desulfurase family protein
VYLDNAATSFPKPDCVYSAADRWMRSVGAAHGRGQYRSAADSAAIVETCRGRLAEILGVGSPAEVCFTFNCTDSLNLVLRGFLRRDDRVLTSMMEHNSVLRPLHQLQRELDLVIEQVRFDPQTGVLDPAEFERALRRVNPRLVVLSHASNVTGCVQPVKILTELSHRTGARVLLDAAQTAGHVPLNLQQLDVDFLAAAGHKGLLGPLGTGVLIVRSGLETEIQPVRCGGTGSNSQSPEQPHELPEKFESGNLNLPGIAGLNASAEFLLKETVEKVHQHTAALTTRLRDGLRIIPGVELYADLSPGDASNSDHESAERVGIVALNIGTMDCREVATILDSSFDIQCRAGLHCAPLTHDVLGTASRGGCVRFSPGYFTTEDQIDAAISAVQQIAAYAS